MTTAAVPRHGFHLRLGVTLLAVGIVAAGVGAWAYVPYLLRSHPGPRSVGSAVEQFRSATTASVPSDSGRSRPAAGVYRLAGQGVEHISFPPNAQKDGATMPASVVYLPGGCWRWHIDYNVAHWEEYDFCPAGGAMVQIGTRNSQSWDFGAMTITNLGIFTCQPPVPVLPDQPTAGQTVQQACTGGNTAVSGQTMSAGPIRIVGVEQIVIQGVAVGAVHEVQSETLSGGQKGTVTENWWFAASNGLPLRVERHISLGTKSPLGTITYTEDGAWQMLSLVPLT